MFDRASDHPRMDLKWNDDMYLDVGVEWIFKHQRFTFDVDEIVSGELVIRSYPRSHDNH